MDVHGGVGSFGWRGAGGGAEEAAEAADRTPEMRGAQEIPPSPYSPET